MTELVIITLENEMDLTLAYKRSIHIGGMLGLTVATQTAFATAVSEVCREVIDKATQGIATLGTIAEAGRFFLAVRINCLDDDEAIRPSEGVEYARKLVPVLEIDGERPVVITLKLSIPRSTRVDQRKISAIKKQIETDGPVSAYEEIKQKNALLADLNQQRELALVHANYLNQQKSEFLSVASHELNSPLTVLRSYAQVALKMGDDNNANLSDFLIKIDNQTGKIVRLVKQLMDISKLEHGDINYEKQIISSREFINSIADAIKTLVNTHQVDFVMGDDCMIFIDTLRLEQVLNNLVNNAAKYSEPGSIITINTNIKNNKLVIAVVDNGIGMSAETQKQVFDKFYRNKQIEKKYSGLGIGLYIASRIINDHDGSMAVNSVEGKGSTFSFSLPLAS